MYNIFVIHYNAFHKIMGNTMEKKKFFFSSWREFDEIVFFLKKKPVQFIVNHVIYEIICIKTIAIIKPVIELELVV
jgi:predicted nucleic acid-binding OB-fold protein